MPFVLKYAIIHGFTKEAKTNIVKDVVKKDVLLKGDLPAVIALVEGVSSLLGKPGNSVTYGQFANDMREGPFPSEFEEYYNKREDENLFLTLSKTAVEQLAIAAAEESLATGGHILVARYLNDGVEFLLVAMIKQRGGVSLDKNYVPISITEIDLSKVYQATRINLSRYEEVAKAEADKDNAEDLDRTYLAFLGQGKENQASGYFVKALGCIKGIASSRATSNAMLIVRNIFERENLRPFRSKARNAVVAYLQHKLAAGENAVLDEVAFAAASCLVEGQEDVVRELKIALNDEHVRMPAEFSVHAQTVKRYIVIKADYGNWSLQFEQQILGDSPNSVIFYNAKNQTLTLNNLDPVLIAKIEIELKNRQG